MRRLHTGLHLLIAASLSAVPTRDDDKYLEQIQVLDNVYVFKPRIDWTHGNGVAIIGPDGVFFIDTFRQYNYAEEAIRRLRRITRLPVVYVFNTHSHNDHTFGNAVFRRIFPRSKNIVLAAAVAPMDTRVRKESGEQGRDLKPTIAHIDSEIVAGHILPRGSPIVGSMKPYWDLMLREAREYDAHYREETYHSPDVTFSDSLTMRWGEVTLQMIRIAEDPHSRSDAILWIPERRLVVAGDIVVGPTPYYSLPGLPKAVRRLIDMNPAIIIPGHGVVLHDLSYLHLLERACIAYKQVADSAFAAKVPLRNAIELSVPEIDSAFIGGDEMRRWTYRSFFTNNVFAKTYNPTPTSPAPAAVPPPEPPLF